MWLEKWQSSECEKCYKIETAPLAWGMSIASDWGLAWQGSERIPPWLGSCSGGLRTDIPSEPAPHPSNLCLSGEATAGNPLARASSEPVLFSFRCPPTAVTQHELGDDTVTGRTRHPRKRSGGVCWVKFLSVKQIHIFNKSAF